MASPLGFSDDTALSMKANVCASRERCSGNTRTPTCPTTIGSPRRHSFIGTQRAVRAARSTSNAAVHLLVLRPAVHCPASRTSVRWFVVL